MPKVNALTRDKKVQQSVSKLTLQTRCDLIEKDIKLSRIAEVLDISPSAVSAQFKRGHISMDVFVTARMLLEGEI